MGLPTFSQIEHSIRHAWAGNLPAARDVLAAAGASDSTLEQPLELLASAPLVYKAPTADAVRAAWVRAGGETPLVPRPGISTPLDQPSRWPHR